MKLPLVEAPAAPAEADMSPAITVAGIDTAGITVYPKSDVDAIFAKLTGGPVHQGDVEEAVRDLQLKYRNDGYFLTKVVGNLEAGAGGAQQLHVRVLEGYIAAVKISGDVGPVATLVYNVLQHLTEIRPVKITDIERYALLAQNIPGLTVHNVLRAAKDEPGAVELVAAIERKPFDAYVTDDNRGPKTAGPNELVVGVSGNSFTSLGDRTEVLLFDTPFDNEQLYAQGSMEWFIGTEGLQAKLYGGFGQSEPGDVLRLVGYRSRLLMAGGSVTYPIIRTRALSLYASAAYDVSRSVIDLRGPLDGRFHRLTNSDLQILSFATHLDTQDSIFGPDHLGANSFELGIHKGIEPQGNSTYLARPEVFGDFLKYTGEIKRTQGLYSWSSTRLDVLFAVAAQWTPEILPPSEKFFLGGNQYGRGFFNGEVTGDRAVGGTVELQLNDGFQTDRLGQPLNVGLQYYGFYDVGQTWDRAVGDAPHHIESTGLGVRANVTEHFSFEVEGVERFSRRPIGGDSVDLLPEHAAYFRIVARL